MAAVCPSSVLRRLACGGAALMLALGAAQAAADPPLTRIPAVRVQRAGVTVPGTPAQYNASITVRYGPSRPRAILLLMPGYLGGAGSFDRLARQIVARDPGVAVWAVDRRSNTLEPQAQLAGADTATLTRIVQDGLPVVPPGRVAFMRDWGLDVTLRDWRAAVQEARRVTPDVFLGGHSLGAGLTGLYAAYDFGGRAGADDVRGLVMLDGLPGTLADREINTDQYDQGGLNALGVLPGLRQLDRQPYVNTLVFGPRLASQAAAQARLAAAAPDALAPERGLSAVPATNLAACLLQLESRYALLPFMTVQTGQPTNAIEAPSFLALALGGRDSHWLVGPQDTSRPVGWQDDPAAPTDGQDFVNRYWTPLADYTEWYFPNRLTLDVAAARTGTVGTPFEQTLHVWHTSALTLPVLGIAAQRGVTQAADFVAYGKKTRGAVTVRTLPGASHLDIVAARSDQVARWIVEWMRPLRTPTPGPMAGPTDLDLAAAHVSP
ncbi:MULTISPECIES: alpha/beta hydrolase [Deinococcus]|uniref:Alpha/beta fold hydrolase n=1 Tax=Deinococcus rufus TaxID=2136097 RepID=A0ABV7Z3U2_9DEIO|nr:alpha/beta fold hydrolase [Deinococcus sp. AB2017081]WQE94741.1 alpha/beta fold hydrolase [Deinococcus sp. AB2017081]